MLDVMSITTELRVNTHAAPRKVSHLNASKLSAKTARIQSHGDSTSNNTSTQRQRPAAQSTFRKDVVFRAINDFHLQGSSLSSYADLLERLGFDLTPFISNGQTWYSCKGRQEDRSPCRRMIPEVYLIACVGEILKAADKPETTGENLVEELAHALSYAVCEHHKEIHKVVRAIELRQVIDPWRLSKPALNATTTIKEELSTPPTISPSKSPELLSEKTVETNGEEKLRLESEAKVNEVQEADRQVEKEFQSHPLNPPTVSSATLIPATVYQAPVKSQMEPISDKQVVEEPEVDELAFSQGPKEKLEVNGAFQTYLRAHSRDRRSDSHSSSGGSSAGSFLSPTKSMRPRAESLHVAWIADEAQ